MKTKLFFAICLIIPILAWQCFGDKFALNFVVASFSFMFITISVFYAQRKNILRRIHNASQEELEALINRYKDEEEETLPIKAIQNHPLEHHLKKHKFLEHFNAVNAKTGIKIFFFPMRLLGYGMLIIGVLTLINHDSFDTKAFFLGLIFANIILVLGILSKILKY